MGDVGRQNHPPFCFPCDSPKTPRPVCGLGDFAHGPWNSNHFICKPVETRATRATLFWIGALCFVVDWPADRLTVPAVGFVHHGGGHVVTQRVGKAPPEILRSLHLKTTVVHHSRLKCGRHHLQVSISPTGYITHKTYAVLVMTSWYVFLWTEWKKAPTVILIYVQKLYNFGIKYIASLFLTNMQLTSQETVICLFI